MMGAMSLTKFEAIDGYALIDIDGATRAVGPVRRAKKVLQRTTEDLIRHATYAAAFHNVAASGGAVALNLDPAADDQSPLTNFVDEASAWAMTTGFIGTALMGLGAEQGSVLTHESLHMSQELLAASAAASAGSVADKNVAVVSEWDEAALTTYLDKAADVSSYPLEDALQSSADIVFVRGKTGVINHEVVAECNVGAIVGLQPLTTTARGLAVASRAGTVIVPDFISAAGPVLAALSSTALSSTADATALSAEVASMVTEAMTSVNRGTDLFVEACVAAETFMRTWTDKLPFGRPLAP